MTTDDQSVFNKINTAAILNQLGDGVLIFDKAGTLVFDNKPASDILGEQLVTIRQDGWAALASIIDALPDANQPSAEEIRARAWREVDPVRFNIQLYDAYTPCWASALHGESDADVFLMITISRPDWSPLSELMKTFRSEASMAINNTKNHADLIRRLATTRPDDMTADQLGERVLGFSELMSADMYRLQTLLEQLHRLEIIRTGQLRQSLTHSRRAISILDFVEDFLEDIIEKPITDTPPEGDLRDRIDIDIPGDLAVYASRTYLEFILRDLLRNALMYSDEDTLIKLRASQADEADMILIEMEDAGYGIREREADRVFKPFLRARQPQVIAEFGYGLSLYLAQANIHAMGGKIWFESEEGAGTTFKILLPTYQGQDEDDSA